MSRFRDTGSNVRGHGPAPSKLQSSVFIEELNADSEENDSSWRSEKESLLSQIESLLSINNSLRLDLDKESDMRQSMQDHIADLTSQVSNPPATPLVRPKVDPPILPSAEQSSKNEHAILALREGDRLVSQGHIEQGLTYFLKANSLDPFNKLILFRAGKAFMDTGKIDQATSFLSQGLSLDFTPPHLPFANLYLGACFALLKDWTKASQYYSAALMDDPFCLNSRLGLIQALQARGRQESALRHCQLAVALNPTDDIALETLAKMEKSNPKSSVNAVALVQNRKRKAQEQSSNPLFKFKSTAEHADCSRRNVPSPVFRRSKVEQALQSLMDTWSEAVDKINGFPS